jgi:hypothetical protein
MLKEVLQLVEKDGMSATEIAWHTESLNTKLVGRQKERFVTTGVRKVLSRLGRLE